MKDNKYQEYICHYTSISSFLGILQGIGKDQNDYINFWATNILTLNDPEEMKYGCELMYTMLTKIETDLGFVSQTRLSNLWLDSFACFPQKLKEILDRCIQNGAHMPYVISLSRYIDDLALWKAYTDKGKGICIVFDYEELTDYILEEECVSFVNILYGDDFLPSVPYESLRGLYSAINNAVNGDFDKLSTMQVEEFLYDCMLSIAPLIKDKGYKYEAESRIHIVRKNDENICFRSSSNGYVIPYINFSIPIHTIRKIIIGPDMDFALTKSMLQLLFNINGLNIPIEQSKNKMRNI